MIFQKSGSLEEKQSDMDMQESQMQSDDIETIVGPSVNVEGDLSSSGNIVVKGTVTGSVNTTKHLTVEKGAKIIANVRAGSASVSGEIKGNLKVKESLELTSTSKVLGDINVRTLTVEPGAAIYGKVSMPGIDPSERKSARAVKRIKKGGV
ncbi:MAG: polymer-forming cytoskeletal protein [Parcubacteria group bacterium]|nr:polymer-forming cytoskeletal protein [Parcubacteria group bacterium]